MNVQSTIFDRFNDDFIRKIEKGERTLDEVREAIQKEHLGTLYTEPEKLLKLDEIVSKAIKAKKEYYCKHMSSLKKVFMGIFDNGYKTNHSTAILKAKKLLKDLQSAIKTSQDARKLGQIAQIWATHKPDVELNEVLNRVQTSREFKEIRTKPTETKLRIGNHKLFVLKSGLHYKVKLLNVGGVSKVKLYFNINTGKFVTISSPKQQKTSSIANIFLKFIFKRLIKISIGLSGVKLFSKYKNHFNYFSKKGYPVSNIVRKYYHLGHVTTKLHIENVKQILMELSNGVNYLHQENLIHRDIKPSNILIHEDKNGIKHAKLHDFDLTVKTKLSLEEAFFKILLGGTTGFIDPAILLPNGLFSFFKNLIVNFIHTNKTNDIYALGMTFFCIAYKKSESEVSLAPSELEGSDKPLDKLILSMIDPVQSKRPTIKEVLEKLESLPD